MLTPTNQNHTYNPTILSAADRLPILKRPLCHFSYEWFSYNINMMIRQLLRGFKSWTQHQAETLGISEGQLQSMQDKLNSGAYQTWKKENANSNKLYFILDHCTPEEQKHYLKEFTTEELGRFLHRELNSMSLEELDKICGIRVNHHRIPGISHIFKFKSYMSTLTALNACDNEPAAGKVIAKKILEAKLKELEWRALDEKISGKL